MHKLMARGAQAQRIAGMIAAPGPACDNMMQCVRMVASARDTGDVALELHN